MLRSFIKFKFFQSNKPCGSVIAFFVLYLFFENARLSLLKALLLLFNFLLCNVDPSFLNAQDFRPVLFTNSIYPFSSVPLVALFEREGAQAVHYVPFFYSATILKSEVFFREDYTVVLKCELAFKIGEAHLITILLCIHSLALQLAVLPFALVTFAVPQVYCAISMEFTVFEFSLVQFSTFFITFSEIKLAFSIEFAFEKVAIIAVAVVSL